MLNKIFTRQPRLEHPDPAQRLLGLAELPADSADLVRLLQDDPAPVVRAAAARQCTDPEALFKALGSEQETDVRATLSTALTSALAATTDDTLAATLLSAPDFTDALRADVARQAPAGARRKQAIVAMGDEGMLIDLALGAEHADTRMAAAERVETQSGLHRLAEQAKNKDHGVARLAKQRLDLIRNRTTQGAEADAILTQLESLAAEPGPILTAVVELNRRWQVLDMSGDPVRLARCESARQTIQARFDREQEEQRAKALYERRLRDWLAVLGSPPPQTPEAVAAVRTSLDGLREDARTRGDNAGLAHLEAAALRIEQWDAERAALAGAEALVLEAERLAADTSIDNADLPTRWQSLNRATRTAELTRRFEAALMMVEQRRLAQVQATQQQASAVKLQLHALLHAAEQALAGGQLQSARAATDDIRALKTAAGVLPKPTTQRLGRVIQQLTDLERWESFGQQQARVQLCERAEALAAQPADPAHIAQEVQKLRNDWKALDQQHAGVPKALWERFDRACEKAYAPAARHFAEMAAQRRDARKRRDEFLAATATHAPTLVTETPDWRMIERWLRETDQTWREGGLGSVDPATWKKLDGRLKEAVAPARDALAAARDKAKAAREALIAEASALGAKAMERDTPSQVKALQLRWQEQAKQLSLAQRDERTLWDRFRAACDAVFEARQSKRKEEDGKKNEGRRALDALCAEVELLAKVADKPDQEIKRALRDAQEQWKTLAGGFDPSRRDVETRFKKASAAIDVMLAGRTRVREAAVWQTLAGKDRLCEELDRSLQTATDPDAAQVLVVSVQQRWADMPDMPPNWEKPVAARRDAAVRALTDGGATSEKQRATIERNATLRRDVLVELELMLGLDSPPLFQTQRLALQVRQLKERFSSAASTGNETASARFVAWCAMPGIADALDRQRSERIVGKLGEGRARP